MLSLWVILLLPFVKNELIQPQFDKGPFLPTTNWISNHQSGDPNDTSMNIPRRQVPHFPPCDCGHSLEPASAFITPVPTTLTLSCQTPVPYEHISWWLFKCPEHGEQQKIVQVTSGSVTYLKGYEVITDHNGKGYFSSLHIKDISSDETSGLYQCVSYALAPSQKTPFFSRTDYFVIGRRSTMKDCLYDAFSREDFTREIKEKAEFINYREPRFGEVFTPENTIIFNFSDAIPRPDLYQVENDLIPPPAQNFTDIPVQNSSYIRFDYTGGDKIQNRFFNKSEVSTKNNTDS